MKTELSKFTPSGSVQSSASGTENGIPTKERDEVTRPCADERSIGWRIVGRGKELNGESGLQTFG